MLTVKNARDVGRYERDIAEAAKALQCRLREVSSPLQLLYDIKFEPVGMHPTERHKLNLIEQINQTWTYLVALAAARWLLREHPQAGGFTLAPGAHAAQDLDIMSINPGVVGAETFAAVDLNNNGKLRGDLRKLALRSEQHRYVFFGCPKYRAAKRRPELESEGVTVQVRSVNLLYRLAKAKP